MFQLIKQVLIKTKITWVNPANIYKKKTRPATYILKLFTNMYTSLTFAQDATKG